MNIEIITTKNNAFKETGFGTFSSCQNVFDSVKQNYTTRITVCTTHQDLEDVLKRKPDLVFLAAKYMTLDNGKDIWFSEYFAKNNITISGSTRETLQFDSDKISAKIHLQKLGIKTARHFSASPGKFKNESEFPFSFPLFLKPLNAANGNGIDDFSYAENFQEFEKKVLDLSQAYHMPVLVEEYLSGKEYTVAIIQSHIGEIICSAIEILPPEDLIKVSEMAIAVFNALGVRGFGRIDIRMDANGECHFMEANLVPGMTQGTSYFPKACEIANNICYDDVVSLMLEECVARARKKKILKKKPKLQRA